MRKSFLILAGIFAACSGRDKAAKKIDSEGYEFVGGADGGCWIRCKEVSKKKFRCSILFEDKTSWDSGLFFSSHDQTTPLNYNSFDGTKILLKDGGFLEKSNEN